MRNPAGGNRRGSVQGRQPENHITPQVPPYAEDIDLLAEVQRVVTKALAAAGAVGSVKFGSPEWWRASDAEKAARLGILAEAFVIQDPHKIALDIVKQTSLDVWEGTDWTALSRRASHSTLVQRRERPGPMLRTFDAEAAARWVEFGTSAVAS